jgi:serine/threonine protein kinase
MHGFFVNETNSNAEKESPSLRISITNQMKNFEVIEILCQLGPYSKRYTVLNQFSPSFRHSYSLLGLGTFGEVFLSTDDTQHFAIKCLKFDLSDSGFLRNCIQEFFIADLLSAIEVGPKLLRTKGFDFILFEDCMEFEMEVCRPIRKETLETDLKASLLKMHQLKVIHSDIKPANVLYSTSYGKNVFLDFGVAEVVNQEIWESTLTKFKGTYEFCGEEMKKLFVKKTQEHVNLYINDL